VAQEEAHIAVCKVNHTYEKEAKTWQTTISMATLQLKEPKALQRCHSSHKLGGAPKLHDPHQAANVWLLLRSIVPLEYGPH